MLQVNPAKTRHLCHHPLFNRCPGPIHFKIHVHHIFQQNQQKHFNLLHNTPVPAGKLAICVTVSLISHITFPSFGSIIIFIRSFRYNLYYNIKINHLLDVTPAPAGKLAICVTVSLISHSVKLPSLIAVAKSEANSAPGFHVASWSSALGELLRRACKKGCEGVFCNQNMSNKEIGRAHV